MAADGAMPVPVTVEQAVRWADTLPGWFLHRLIIVTEHIGLMSRIPGFTWPEVGWSDDVIVTLRRALQSLFRDHVARTRSTVVVTTGCAAQCRLAFARPAATTQEMPMRLQLCNLGVQGQLGFFGL